MVVVVVVVNEALVIAVDFLVQRLLSIPWSQLDPTDDPMLHAVKDVATVPAAVPYFTINNMVNELAEPSRPQWVGIAGVMNPSKQWCTRSWGFHTDLLP